MVEKTLIIEIVLAICWRDQQLNRFNIGGFELLVIALVVLSLIIYFFGGRGGPEDQ